LIWNRGNGGKEDARGVGEDEGKRLTVNMENALINNRERRSSEWITSSREVLMS
jgi:hypothetical protein